VAAQVGSEACESLEIGIAVLSLEEQQAQKVNSDCQNFALVIVKSKYNIVKLIKTGNRVGFYPVVAIATTKNCRGVERFPKHIPVDIFVSSRVDQLMFARSSVFSIEELRSIIGLYRRHFRYF